MAESDVNDLVNFLSQKKAQPAAPTPTDIMGQLAPLTQQALASTGQNAPPSKLVAAGNLSWFDRNQRKDEQGRVIPIDIDEGINLGDYGRMVWQRRPEERMSVLKKLFPNQIVRMSDTGEPIVEVIGKGGERKDVLVNPPGFSAQDLLEVGATAPETAGSAAGAVLGGIGGGAVAGPPGVFAGRILGAATGAAVGGAFKDVAARGAEGLPLNLSEIEKARASEAELNALFDFGLGVGAKALRLGSIFAKPGELEFNQQKARDYFKREHGVDPADLPVTPGERTGSKILRRIEAYEAPQPGSSTVIGAIQEKGDKTITRLLNVAIGKRVPDEQLGTDLVTTLKTKIASPVQGAVDKARDELVKKGETELVNIIDSVAGVGKTTRGQAGEAAREAFAAKHAEAKVKRDAAYAAVKALPGGTGKALPANPLLGAAQEILDELPTSLKTEVKPDYDAYGNPTAKTVVKKEVLASGRPESLLTFLGDMKKLKGQKMSLDELTTLKNAARDEIAKTEAVPGVKDRWFSKISAAYDQAITEGVETVGKKEGNTALADALSNAREVYKKEFLPFDREGLHDLLRTPYESGYVSPEQLVSRLFSGSRADHNYRVLQETLGATSPAFTKIKRSLLDSWMLDATDPLTKRINPETLETALTAFRKSHSEIYKDIIGSQEQQLFQITRSLRAAGKEIGDIDPNELGQLLRSGNVTRDNIVKLRDAQRVRDTTFVNPILKQLEKTGVLPDEVSPIAFVRSLYNTDIPSDRVKAVLANLKPEQVEDLRIGALYRILDKAGEFKSDYAPAWVSGTQGPVSAQGLAKALGSPGSLERARNELLLGKDATEFVQNAINYMAPREIKATQFKSAGGISSGMAFRKLLDAPLQYASMFTRKLVAAVVYTSEPMQKLISNQVFGPKETAALANILISSEPFLKRVYEVAGEDAAHSIVGDLKRSIDRSLIQDGQPSQQEAQKEELMQFLRTQKGKVKIEARP